MVTWSGSASRSSYTSERISPYIGLDGQRTGRGRWESRLARKYYRHHQLFTAYRAGFLLRSVYYSRLVIGQDGTDESCLSL